MEKAVPFYGIFKFPLFLKAVSFKKNMEFLLGGFFELGNLP